MRDDDDNGRQTTRPLSAAGLDPVTAQDDCPAWLLDLIDQHTPETRPQSAAGLDPVDQQADSPQWLRDLVEEEVGKSLPAPRSARLVLMVRRRGEG